MEGQIVLYQGLLTGFAGSSRQRPEFVQAYSAEKHMLMKNSLKLTIYMP